MGNGDKCTAFCGQNTIVIVSGNLVCKRDLVFCCFYRVKHPGYHNWADRGLQYGLSSDRIFNLVILELLDQAETVYT